MASNHLLSSRLDLEGNTICLTAATSVASLQIK